MKHIEETLNFSVMGKRNNSQLSHADCCMRLTGEQAFEGMTDDDLDSIYCLDSCMVATNHNNVLVQWPGYLYVFIFIFFIKFATRWTNYQVCKSAYRP